MALTLVGVERERESFGKRRVMMRDFLTCTQNLPGISDTLSLQAYNTPDSQKEIKSGGNVIPKNLLK